MEFLSSSQIDNVIRSYANGDFALIAALTFFLCEAVFACFPVERARMKQLTSLAIGAALGLLFAKGASGDALIRGILAGGATTMSVAKFKKPSFAPAGATDGGPSSAPASQELPIVGSAPSPIPSPVLPEPVEHL